MPFEAADFWGEGVPALNRCGGVGLYVPLLGPLGGGSFDAIGVLTVFGLFTCLCHRQITIYMSC